MHMDEDFGVIYRLGQDDDIDWEQWKGHGNRSKKDELDFDMIRRRSVFTSCSQYLQHLVLSTINFFVII